MKLKQPVALVTDFDGTISYEDFFWHVINAYLDPENDLEPWHDYKNNKITHFEALSKIFGKIRAEKNEFDDFIEKFEIDENFLKTLNLCKEKKIPVYIVSAGSDYYIKRKLKGQLKEFDITLVSNPGVYSFETGLEFLRHDENYEFYNHNVGISKPGVVKALKEKGYFCIFAGDGIPDFPAAKEADVIFAKKSLLELCQKDELKTEKFDNYNDIYEFINKLEIS